MTELDDYLTRIASLERQLAAEVADHNNTRRQLLKYKHRHNAIQARIGWLIGDAFPDETIDEIKEVLDLDNVTA